MSVHEELTGRKEELRVEKSLYVTAEPATGLATTAVEEHATTAEHFATIWTWIVVLLGARSVFSTTLIL